MIFIWTILSSLKKMNQEYQNKKVLITGGLGFIGSNLAINLLAQGAVVTLIDNLKPEFGGNHFNIVDIRNKVNVNIADIRDATVFEELLKDKDILFNLAAQTSHVGSMSDPMTDLDINVVGQLSILEACRKFNPDIKIVFGSTRQVYGKPAYLPVDEAHPVRPVDVNGINKHASEGFHLLYSKVYGLRTCVLRMTNTYGPRMRIKDAKQIFLGSWIRLIMEGKPIKVFGDGSQLRDFNFVDDCVDALLATGSSERSNGKLYNLGSSEVISLKNLAKKLCSFSSGSQFELVPFPEERKKIDIGDYYGDFSLITEELGWKPKTNLNDGLRKTIEYYRITAANY